MQVTEPDTATDAPNESTLPRVGVDGLLPPQIAAAAEKVGAAKGNLDAVSTFLLAVLAGAFIAMGAIFATTAIVGAADLPFGVSRVLAGLTFCLGLILVVVGGAELFTGNNLLVMACVSRKLTVARLLRNWVIVYAGNFVGALATAVLMLWTAQYMMAEGAVGLTAIKIATDKCDLSFTEAVTRGIYCNALVCLAIWLCLSCRTTTDKILAIVFPITAFVAAGFEHSVANMYFIPIGLLIKQWAGPEFWQAVGVSSDAFGSLTWSNFLLANLLPVTIGNIIGGSLFVGVVYWLIYRRPTTR